MDAVHTFKADRLRWVGRVSRKISRKVLRERIYGRRRTGRPRLWKADGVAADARTTLGVRDWQTAALDTVGWQSMLKEAMIARRL